ncbi:hypothetical protein IKS57_05570 [bacterium]|nr:hypothetical protein [bacterium]
MNVNATINTYYVVSYVNNEKYSTSKSITITPTYTSSLFSAVILNNANQESDTINDIDGSSSYDLKAELYYDNVPFTVQPSKVV